MTQMAFTIDGMDEMLNKLKSKSKEVQDKACIDAVTSGALIIETHAKFNLDRQKLRDTGNLINSVAVHRTHTDGAKSWAEVGSSGVVYARIHEFGGLIKAKRANNLAIPMTKSAKRAGSPRKMSGLHYVPIRVGGVLIDEANVLQYVLKPFVTIPARPWLRPAVDEHHADIRKAMGDAIMAVLNK